MSVVPMKLVTIAGPLDSFDAVVRKCVVNREFQPENVFRVMRDVKNLRPCDTSNPYTALLRRAEQAAGQTGVTLEYDQEADGETVESISAYLDGLEGRIEELHRQHDLLAHEADEDRTVIQQLENLHGLSTNLDELRSLTYLRFRYGHLPRETYDSFKVVLGERNDTFFFPTVVKSDLVYGVYFTTKAAHDEVDSLFNSLHFTRIVIDDRVDGTADDAIQTLAHEAEEAERAAADRDAQLALLKTTERRRLVNIWSWLRFQNDIREVRRYAGQTKETFYLMGWVPASELEAARARLKEFGGLSVVVDDAEDISGVTPPTKLKNNFFARVFEPFLKMYGVPSYNELDPSLFMAITYCLFFGIMFGDIGQGLGLALIGFIIARWKKNWLGNIITCCGLSGALFGCFYGSIFGNEHILPGFKILEKSASGGSNVMTLLIGSIGLGVCMLAFVMVLNIINGVRQRNWEKILFGHNGAAGMVFYLGLIIMAVGSLLFDLPLMTPAYVIPVLILPLVLMLLREPLTMLLDGNPEWKKISIGSLLGSGFFELFETLLSYLTNTLSFLRIGAYAITHVGLMMVVQALAGSGNIVVMVLGNLFVMGFEGLLVGIQVLRLEFYELFGRFYADGGVEYKPMIIDRPR